MSGAAAAVGGSRSRRAEQMNGADVSPTGDCNSGEEAGRGGRRRGRAGLLYVSVNCLWVTSGTSLKKPKTSFSLSSSKN